MNYPEYRSLSSTAKHQRISEASSTESDRKPHPLNNQQFPQQNFINLRVFQNSKQIKLHTYRHKHNPMMKLKGIIFIFHGLNAHIGQAAHVARVFAENGYTCVGFDHRGFGKSEGEKGLVEDLEQHLSDSLQFIKIVMQEVQSEYEYKTLYFGMGLSMGGMTVYHLALRNPKLFDSVILMAPALMHNLPSFVPFVTKMISSILPNSTKLLPPFADRSNKNPNVTEYRKKDPYCFNDRAYLRTMNFIVKVMNESQITFKQFKCPFLIVQGGLDKLVNPEVAFKIYDQASVDEKEKRLLFYENMWHGIWHQDEIWEILKQSLIWLDQRVKLNSNEL